MRSRTLLACALVAASLTSCRWLRSRLALPLPSQRPADFAFGYSHGGGMRPVSIELSCSARACRYEHRVMGRGDPVERVPSAAQLDAVYAAFRDHGFHRITTIEQGFAHDAPTTSVSVHIADHDYRVVSSASQNVTPWDRDRFRAALDAIESLQNQLFADVIREAAARESSPAP